MSDLISRREAVDALCQRCDLVSGDDEPCTEECNDIKILKLLPSAQPEQDEWCTDCKEYDSERHCCPRFNRVIRKALKDVQPIIRCKDCKNFGGGTYCYERDGMWGENDFCSYAERKEQDDG